MHDKTAARRTITDKKQIRLTYNYWRKGGYSIGSEDYRWEIVKKQVTPFQMFIFNVLFISFAQSVSSTSCQPTNHQTRL